MTNHPRRSHFQKYPAPPEEAILAARKVAGLTQDEAAKLVNRTPQWWHTAETGVRAMDPTTWELFLLKTNQHPNFHLLKRDVAERLTKKWVLTAPHPQSMCETCREKLVRKTVVYVI